MNNGDSGELRDLIAKLSGGTLNAAEAVRLNDLLKGDPIAQESYLDHLMVDALLECEFGEFAPMVPASAMGGLGAAHREGAGGKDRPSRSRTTAFSSFRLPALVGRTRAVAWASAFLLLVSGAIGAGCLLSNPPRRAGAATRLVVGFEADAPSEGGPTSRRFGDEVESVGEYLGVTPIEGRRMLRFVSPSTGPGDACEVYQVVNLRLLGRAARREAIVEASAFFNSAKETIDQTDYAFGITLFAFTDDPKKEFHDWPQRWRQPLDFSGRQLSADDAPQTWQQVDTRMPLPDGARFLVVRLSVLRTNPKAEGQFPGQFVDQLALRLVDSR